MMARKLGRLVARQINDEGGEVPFFLQCMSALAGLALVNPTGYPVLIQNSGQDRFTAAREVITLGLAVPLEHL